MDEDMANDIEKIAEDIKRKLVTACYGDIENGVIIFDCGTTHRFCEVSDFPKSFMPFIKFCPFCGSELAKWSEHHGNNCK